MNYKSSMNKHNKDSYFHKNKIQKYFPKRKLTDDDYFTICCLKKNHNKHYKHKNNKFHKNQSTYINSLDKTQASTNGNQSKSNSFTIHGDVKVEVPSGIQNGQKLRIKGKGIKDLRSANMGDEYVILDIKVPSKLTKDEKDLYKKLRDIEIKSGESIFEKFKKAFKAK